MPVMLNLFEPRTAGWPEHVCLDALLTSPAERRGSVVLLGAGDPPESAVTCDALPGLLPAGPARWSVSSRALRRYVRTRGLPDCFVCWSIAGALTVARAALATPCIVVLNEPPPRTIASSEATALRRADLIVYPSAHLRDCWIARLTLLGVPSTVIPPPIDRGLLSTERRAAVREEWGVGERDFVITCAGEPEASIQARTLAFFTSVVNVSGARAVVVAPPRADQLERSLRFAERLRPQLGLIVDPRPLAKIVAACDAVLWLDRPAGSSAIISRYSPGSGIVGLLWAASSGAGIVAHDHPAARESLSDSPRVRFFTSGSTRTATGALLEVLSSPRSPVSNLGLEPVAWRDRFIESIDEVVRDHRRRTGWRAPLTNVSAPTR